MYRSMEELLAARLQGAKKKRAVVAGADDEHVLEAVFAAQEQGYIEPILVGNESAVRQMLGNLGLLERDYTLVPCAEGENPSAIAVEQIHAGAGDFIVKGRLETKDLLRPILNKQTGLNKRGFITHFGYMQLKNYHKMLAISDSAAIPYPTLEEKKKIIQAGVDALRSLGYEKPVVGVLCAVESVSDKMPETQDAAQLLQMAEEGAFGSCEMLAPISFDLATSRTSAEIKGYAHPYAGEVDFLLVPQMVTGNVMSKIWNADPDNCLAGCLTGADVPIVLTSRSASAEEKLSSILLCAAMC